MQLQDDFQREERRSILLIGLSIIILALTVSPIGPLLTSSLALLATFWVIYALGMIIYFSDDLFPPRTRRTARVIGLTCFFVYPCAVILTMLSAAAAVYMFPYASITNWAMVAVGTFYAILIGGRILRFQKAQPVTPAPTPSTSTPGEIDAVFHAASVKADHAKRPLKTMVEKIPKPTIRPLAVVLPAATSGVSAPFPLASPRRSRKPKTIDSTEEKRPIGPTSGRKPPPHPEASDEPPSKGPVSNPGS